MNGKKLYYQSGFTSPVLHVSCEGGAYRAVPLEDAGEGRWPGERRWAARDFAPSGASVRFFVTGGNQRDPRRRFYETSLNEVYVQDGQLFDYSPTARVAAPRKDYRPNQPPGLFSMFLGEYRHYRVYLPRGYYQHHFRRYPVLYMLDGQNVFDGGAFGCWNAKRALDRVIARGQVRELIVVAVDASRDRFRDYVPPEDGGRADAYARFMVSELKPHIDRRLRTIPHNHTTGILGSSLAGVAALYMGWEFFHIYGRVGCLSGSWWLRNFRRRILSQPRRAIKFYLDSGDSGVYNDSVRDTLELRDELLCHRKFNLGQDFCHLVAHHHEHNESAWEARLPNALRFLFPAA